MIKNIILIFQILFAIVLVFLIIIQAKGTGLSSSILGTSTVYSTKRGVEKIVYYGTVVTAVLFLLLQFLFWQLNKFFIYIRA